MWLLSFHAQQTGENRRRLSEKVQMQGGDSSAGFAGATMGEVRKGGVPPSEESLRRRWVFFISLLGSLRTGQMIEVIGDGAQPEAEDNKVDHAAHERDIEDEHHDEQPEQEREE